MPDDEPRPAAVSFLTTEHFTLQGARSATIAESTGRATMFLGAVSGGLVALGLVATATHLGRAFYAFALVLLPLLAFVGLVTFERTLQTGIEDHGYARRIARLRAYYFDHAPELLPYLLSVSPDERLHMQGLFGGRGQRWRTIAGMVAVITAALWARGRPRGGPRRAPFPRRRADRRRRRLRRARRGARSRPGRRLAAGLGDAPERRRAICGLRRRPFAPSPLSIGALR